LVDGVCQPQCQACGVTCQSRRIVDNGNLEYYRNANCTILLGDLYITSETDLLQSDLAAAFSSVSIIRGDLVISGNLRLTSLWFFAQLATVDNIVITDNAALVDARIPSLDYVEDITMSGNPRLCDNRAPKSPLSASQINCVSLEAIVYIVVETEPTLSVMSVNSALNSLFSGERRSSFPVCSFHLFARISLSQAVAEYVSRGFVIVENEESNVYQVTVSNISPRKEVGDVVAEVLQYLDTDEIALLTGASQVVVRVEGSPLLVPESAGLYQRVRLYGLRQILLLSS
jgi:hypothetical protein